MAQDLDDKAKVDVSTAEQHVRVLGADPGRMRAPLIELRAPVAGNDCGAERSWVRRSEEPGQYTESFYHCESQRGLGGV